MTKKTILSKKSLPFKAGDRVRCIRRDKIPKDSINYMDGHYGIGGVKIQLKKIYIVDYAGIYVSGEPVVILKGKNNFFHLTSNFRKVRKVKK